MRHSFGFRGHRYELKNLNMATVSPFCAWSWDFGEGEPLRGLIALFRDLASWPRLAN
jgi:hypothetical protein